MHQSHIGETIYKGKGSIHLKSVVPFIMNEAISRPIFFISPTPNLNESVLQSNVSKLINGHSPNAR